VLFNKMLIGVVYSNLLGLIGVLSRRVRPQYGKYIDINRHPWIFMPYLFL
jgi:hypothetical protein